MPRVFIGLVSGHVIVLMGALALGLLAPRVGQDVHIVLGVFGLLLTALIQAVVLTYFVVSGKMMRQAVSLGSLDDQPLRRHARDKRIITRWVALAIMIVIVTTATGASRWRTGSDSYWHLACAFLAVIVHVIVYWQQFTLVHANAHRFDRIMEEYGVARGSLDEAAQGGSNASWRADRSRPSNGLTAGVD